MTLTGHTKIDFMSGSTTLISGLSKLAAANRPSAVSIGNYDGVHLGHQHVINTLLQKSHELDVPSTVITFEPLAKEFFNRKSIARLTSLQQRAELLIQFGVTQVLSIDFTQDFANYSPDRFVDEVLVDGLGVQYLSVGDDFRFGKDREGDFGFLKRAADVHGFIVEAHQTFEYDKKRVSSGRVRLALADSDFDLAAKLLGRPFSIQGEVSKGQQLGRTINFPTANIVLDDYALPVSGVFAVRCRVNDDSLFIDGVANIGKRPTVKGKENRLEVHLFDFNQDIYGQKLDVQLVEKIREEQKFDGVEALQQQIKEDVVAAKCHFL